MPKGIEIEDVVPGTGPEALRGKTVIVKLRVSLNDGTELTGKLFPEEKVKINLGKRDCIDGLRRGIEGMRVGGIRKMVIAPHLAYGAAGVKDCVPPNALLRFEVELLEVRDSDIPMPEDCPPGQQLFVFHPGEASRGLPRWQFHLEENGEGGALIHFPIPGMTWRHTRRKSVSVQLDQAVAAALFQSAIDLPRQFAAECLAAGDLWADSSEPTNSVTRDKATNSRCITISVSEQRQYKSYYSMSENSRALLDSELYRGISSLLEPHLAAPY